MKFKFILAILVLGSSLFGQPGYPDVKSNHFALKFYSVGFGSNLNTAQPVFNITGNTFIYMNVNAWNSSQNSVTELRDTICIGRFRTSSIDSIVKLVESVKDTLISETNLEITSGASDFLLIRFNEKQVKFELHNAHNQIVYEVVKILNAYIHDVDKKIWVYDKNPKRH